MSENNKPVTRQVDSMRREYEALAQVARRLSSMSYEQRCIEIPKLIHVNRPQLDKPRAYEFIADLVDGGDPVTFANECYRIGAVVFMSVQREMAQAATQQRTIRVTHK